MDYDRISIWGSSRHLAGTAIVALVLLGSSGCGGGGKAVTTPGGKQESSLQLWFEAPVQRTVFADGEARFTLGQALASDEKLVCRFDAVVVDDCAVTPDRRGVLRFRGAAAGSHTVRLEVRAGDALKASSQTTVEVVRPSVVVYSATPAGITAAVAAARAGQTVALLEPTRWVGGMMSGGLGKTDLGTRGNQVLGGLGQEVLQRVRALELRWGACDGGCPDDYDFEPRAAEAAFEQLLAQTPGVVVERSARLAAVAKDGTRIVSVTTSRGTVAGAVFVDASYEGDLMAGAGVSHRIGREARDASAGAALLEEHAGARASRLPWGTYVDPFRIPGQASSGTLPFVEPRASGSEGSADTRVMAYTYRLCVTDDPGNRRPFAPPAGYDPVRYEASARLAVARASSGVDLGQAMFNPAPTVRSGNRAYMKYDLNGGSTFSTDMTAEDMNQRYVEADEAGREAVRRAYREYIEGLLYFWQSDPRFGSLNAKMARFGYCRDEFTDRGGWPHQLYVRAARRMQGEYVMNENDVMQNGRRPRVTDPVAMAAYDIDHHSYRYHVRPVKWPGETTPRDALAVEGFLIVHLPNDKPYPVAYRSLTPKRAEAQNLLNPVTLSATNMAYSSLRMEPTFMMLGHAAGLAATLAVESRQAVQDLDYATLRARLQAAGQKL